MSSVTDVIAELVKAADNSDKLSATEKVQLLDRAITTIREMRGKVVAQSCKGPAGDVVDLRMTRVTLARSKPTSDRFRAALLDAADMIRALHNAVDRHTAVVVDKGTMH
jgi:rRNA processing protein Krr1/Pno1